MDAAADESEQCEYRDRLFDVGWVVQFLVAVALAGIGITLFASPSVAAPRPRHPSSADRVDL
jgi:hypothetical protein